MALAVSKEVKVGIFTLISGVVLYLGFNFLKGSDMLSDSREVNAIFRDVGGLQTSNPVQINGLNVGRVKKLTLTGKTENAVVATLEIDNPDLVLYKGSSVTLVATDLLGGKALRLNMPAKATEPLAEGDTIPAEVEQGFTDKIAASMAPVLANLDSISAEAKVLLRSFRGTSRELEKTLSSVRGTTDATTTLLTANQTNIAAITGNAARLTSNLAASQHQLDAILVKFNRFGDSLNKVRLAQTVENLNKTVKGLSGVLADVNAGKGSLGKLTKNDSLYTNLNKSSEDLDALLKDMKSRPSRYIHFSVFGKKDKE